MLVAASPTSAGNRPYSASAWMGNEGGVVGWRRGDQCCRLGAANL